MNYVICDCNSPYVFCLFVCFGGGEREGEGGGGRGAGRMNCFVLSRSMYDCNSLGAWSEGEGGGACELCYTWLQLTLYLFWFFLGGGRGGRGGRRKGRGQGVWIVLFCVALFVVVICSVYVIATHSSGHTCQGVIWGRREGGEGVRIVLFCVAQRHFDASGLVEGCDSGCCSVYCSVLQSVAV